MFHSFTVASIAVGYRRSMLFAWRGVSFIHSCIYCCWLQTLHVICFERCFIHSQLHLLLLVTDAPCYLLGEVFHSFTVASIAVGYRRSMLFALRGVSFIHSCIYCCWLQTLHVICFERCFIHSQLHLLLLVTDAPCYLLGEVFHSFTVASIAVGYRRSMLFALRGVSFIHSCIYCCWLQTLHVICFSAPTFIWSYRFMPLQSFKSSKFMFVVVSVFLVCLGNIVLIDVT